MYKEIFKLVVAIISQPGKAWDILTKKEEKDDEFLSRFVYPLIGFVTVAAFLGVLFTRKEFDVELALKSSIRTLVAAFGGFYLASYLLNELWQGLFKREKDMKLCQRFVGYSSSLMFALNIVLMLLPEFFFLRIFVLYTFYIVWEGAGPYMQVEEKIRLKFVGIATGLILLTPWLIEVILSMLVYVFDKRSKMKEKISNNIQIKNKRATFDYELLDTFTAGIVLTGTEIKSIRLGKASLVDTFCIVEKGELWVKNMYVAEYFYGTYNNHTTRRDRKLLLTKKELRKIESAARNNGFTIIPTRLFINEKGLAKVVVAIAKGKKEYDKRDSIKERDDRREMDRAFKRN